jgi:hypothetical protein
MRVPRVASLYFKTKFPCKSILNGPDDITAQLLLLSFLTVVRFYYSEENIKFGRLGRLPSSGEMVRRHLLSCVR